MLPKTGGTRTTGNHRSPRVDESRADPPEHGLQAVARSRLLQQTGQVVLHGGGFDEEPVGDLRVGESLRQEVEDLELAVGER